MGYVFIYVEPYCVACHFPVGIVSLCVRTCAGVLVGSVFNVNPHHKRGGRCTCWCSFFVVLGADSLLLMISL